MGNRLPAELNLYSFFTVFFTALLTPSGYHYYSAMKKAKTKAAEAAE